MQIQRTNTNPQVAPVQSVAGNILTSSSAKVAGQIGGLLAYWDTDEVNKITMPDKKYKKFFSEFERAEGYFNFYFRKQDNKTLMEIKPEQLDKVFILSCYRITALPKKFRFLDIQDFGFDSDTMKENYAVYFKRIGGKIHFFAKNLDARSNDKSYNMAIEKSGNDIFLGSTDIKAINSDNGNMIIEPENLLVKDADNVVYFLNLITTQLPLSKQLPEVAPLIALELGLDKNNSYLSKPKTFAKNSEIPVTLTYSSKEAADLSFQINYNFSFSDLPQNSYQPRAADSRIGYFKTSYESFDNDKLITDKHTTELIHRWHLEKADPSAKLSPPKKAIVFWIANTVPKEPKEIREGIKRGFLNWNPVFESVGIKDAIVVKEQPDDADWDPSDIRYNTINFFMGSGSNKYAMGASQVNPITGEIYAADIILDFEAINGDIQEMFLLDENMENIKDENTRKEYINKALVNIIAAWVCHEVGHTLGLEHNFAGSTYQKDGNTASIMDYLPANIPSDNKTTYYMQDKPGDYDYLAIQYGYGSKEDFKKAPQERIKQNIPFATNEHEKFDPYCTQFDYEKNPLDFCKELLNRAQRIWGKIETKFEKPGADYETLTKIFNKGFKRYSNAVEFACKYLGGTRHNNIKVGDIPGKANEEPVSPEDQRAALKFLAENIFSPTVFSFSPQLISKLAPLSPSKIAEKQSKALDDIFDKKTFERIEDNEKKYAEKPFKTSEVFKIITDGIFSEILKPKTGDEINMNFYRMDLQKAYIKKLQAISTPTSEFPKDAKKAAESELSRIKGEVSYVLQKVKHKELKMPAEVEEHLTSLMEKN